METKNIMTFKAKFHGSKKTFEISEIAGGDGIWALYIDRYFQGNFSEIGGVWKFLPYNSDNFTSDQIKKLEDMLTKHVEEFK